MVSGSLVRRGWMALMAVVLLAGCETEVRETAGGRWVEILPGGSLTLNRSISIPQDRARAFFRGGRTLTSGANVGPSCGIEVRTIPRDGPHIIRPGVFTIIRVQNYWTEVAQRPLTGAGRLRLASSTDGGGTPLIQEGYHLWLAGGSDPNVMRLTCLGMLDDMWQARPPTLTEIRAALGSLATLDLTVSGPR